MTTYNLPWPPSVNGYWRTFRNRQIISKRGRDYRNEAIAEVLEQGRKKHDGRLRVVLTAHPPDKRRRDLANVVKATMGALTPAGVWDDDSQIDDLRIVRAGCVEEGMMLVEITTLC